MAAVDTDCWHAAAARRAAETQVMQRNAQLFFAALLAGSGASPLAAQSASEVSIDRIEWFSGGACTIYLTLKNSGGLAMSATAMSSS